LLIFTRSLQRRKIIIENTLTPSFQDYLEIILKLSDDDTKVRVTDIAINLNISKASVTQAIDTLIGQGYVSKEKYGPVTLTRKGTLEAMKIINIHKVIREFLIKVLETDSDVADKDACLMEHIISPQTIERMISYLEKGRFEISNDLDLKETKSFFNRKY